MAYDDIAFCRRPDGKLWLLGSGTHGKVRCASTPLLMRARTLVLPAAKSGPCHLQGFRGWAAADMHVWLQGQHVLHILTVMRELRKVLDF